MFSKRGDVALGSGSSSGRNRKFGDTNVALMASAIPWLKPSPLLFACVSFVTRREISSLVGWRRHARRANDVRTVVAHVESSTLAGSQVTILDSDGLPVATAALASASVADSSLSNKRGFIPSTSALLSKFAPPVSGGNVAAGWVVSPGKSRTVLSNSRLFRR